MTNLKPARMLSGSELKGKGKEQTRRKKAIEEIVHLVGLILWEPTVP